MSNNDLNAQVTTYFALLAEIEELTAQTEAIKDTIKAEMVDRVTEDLTGDGWRATWHNTSTTRLDTKAFRAAHADLYRQYSKTTSGTRFTLQRVKAGA